MRGSTWKCAFFSELVSFEAARWLRELQASFSRAIKDR